MYFNIKKREKLLEFEKIISFSFKSFKMISKYSEKEQREKAGKQQKLGQIRYKEMVDLYETKNSI